MKFNTNRGYWKRSLLTLITTLALPLLPDASGKNILLVVNSFLDPATPSNANDQEVYGRLVSQSHVVTLADHNNVTVNDLTGQDLVLISSSSSSTAASLNALCLNVLKTGKIPIVCYEPGLYDELGLQRGTTFGNAGGHTTLQISTANQGHPLAAGKSGTVGIVNEGFTATVSSSATPLTLGTDAIVIASTTSVDPGRVATWGHEKGSRLADNASTTTSRRVGLFYNASTAPGGYNDNALALFDAAVNWALQPPPVLPLIMSWRSPAPLNASPTAPLVIEVEDGSSQLNPGSIELTLDGSAVTPTTTKVGAVTTIRFQPATLSVANSQHTAQIIVSDNDSPARKYTNSLSFQVAPYITLAANSAYPISAADATAPGFKARVVQANTLSGTLVNSAARAEAQLAGTLVDPATGTPYTNDANTTGAGPDGFFIDADVINWSEDAQGFGNEQGNFRDPVAPDEFIPGIPGVDGINTDNIAAEILTFLELKAGAYTFGVNSDDGFVLSSAADARDVLGSVLGRFDGGRGSTDTTFVFVAPADGLYSFRLLWYEGNGDANLEFFSIDPATGAKILINDRSNPAAIKAYRQITAPTRSYISSVSPGIGANNVDVASNIEITFTNGGIPVNTSSVQVRLNGQVVPITSTTLAGNTVKVVADPASNLTGTTTYNVEVTYADTAANTVTSSFSFTTIRPAINLPPIQQDAAGFAVIEAENFDANVPQGVHAWVFDRTPAGYTGEGTMYALPDAPGAVINFPDTLTTSPRLDYKVNFSKTGTHYFWFRGSDGGGNSINAGFNNANGDNPLDTLNNIDAGCCGTRLVPGGTTYAWVGSGPNGRATFEVTEAGVHTINLWMREDGQIVDKILVTTDANYTPTGAGPDQSARVGQQSPTISITSPTAGQAFPANGSVVISVNAADGDGTIEKVEFFSGEIKIGESTTAPFSFTWPNVPDGRYTLTARATDNQGLTAFSSAVSIVVGIPPKQVLFVRSAAGSASDTAIVARLREMGFQVTEVVDSASATSQAADKDLIVISSTVGSGNVATKFTASAVPIITWETALADELGLENDNVNGATIGAQTEIEITNSTHPLAAGLNVGNLVVYSTAGDVGSLGTVVPGAVVIATAVDGTARPVLFGVEKDVELNPARIAAAPARRVFLFFGNNTYVNATADGKKLFDAAVNWALNITEQPPIRMQISRTANQVTITWSGGGTLESTATLGATASWTTVPGGSPVTITPNEPQRFYRVRR